MNKPIELEFSPSVSRRITKIGQNRIKRVIRVQKIFRIKTKLADTYPKVCNPN